MSTSKKKENNSYPAVVNKTFNLVDEPWVKVRMSSGNVKEMSLNEIFERSSDIISLSGENSIQNMAIFRMLLAIMHRSLDVSFDNWVQWYHKRAYPVASIEKYLSKWREHFWLFHPTQPFMQVADAESKSSIVWPISKMIPESTSQFSLRNPECLSSIDYAEAARSLVCSQGYNPPGGIHMSLTKADNPKKHPKASSLNMMQAIRIEKGTLFETLMMALIPYDSENASTSEINGGVASAYDSKSSMVPWEHPQTANFHDESNQIYPTGRADALVWQGRRIRLIPVSKENPVKKTYAKAANGVRGVMTVVPEDGFDVTVPDDGVVIGCLIAPGDAYPKESFSKWEDMGALGYHKKSKDSPEGFRNLYNDSRDSSMWRSLAPLLIFNKSMKNLEAYISPNTIKWANELVSDGIIKDSLFTISNTRIIYGPQYAKEDEIIKESVSLPDWVINGDIDTRMNIIAAAELANGAEKAFSSFLSEMALARGNSSPREKNHEAADIIYSKAEQIFTDNLENASDSENFISEWKRNLRHLCISEMKDWESTYAAVSARMILGDGEHSLSSAERKLYSILKEEGIINEEQ